jgi:hypothetical protein
LRLRRKKKNIRAASAESAATATPTPTPIFAPVKRPDDDEDGVLDGVEEVVTAGDGSVVVAGVEVEKDVVVVEELLLEAEEVG